MSSHEDAGGNGAVPDQGRQAGGGPAGRATTRRRAAAPGGGVLDDSSDRLRAVGLSQGDSVRWQPTAGGRWKLGRATRLERDGSVGVTDERGLARSLAVERLEVRCSGRRGGQRWEPLADRARTVEQLRLV